MEHEDTRRPSVSAFDYSVENHFKAMDTIQKLCNCKEEEEGEETLGQSERERFLSKITFLREWKYYSYDPRVVRIASESKQGKDVIDGVNLPQFSSTNIPKTGRSSKDFILYVGGPVWGLDWCPSVHQRKDDDIKCEYLAVASHPPRSSPYHKIGVPLTGRGVIQIWCVLNGIGEEEEPEGPISVKKKRGRPRKQFVEKGTVKEKDSLPKKPRGRPRKHFIEDDEESDEESEDVEEEDEESEDVEEVDEESDGEEEEVSVPLKKPRGRPKKIVDNDEKSEDVEEEDSVPLKKPRGRPRKQIINVGNDYKKSRGRPRKKQRGRPRKKKDSSDELKGENNLNQAACDQSVTVVEIESNPVKRSRGKPRKKSRGRSTKKKESPDSVHSSDKDNRLEVKKESIDDLKRENHFYQIPCDQTGNLTEKEPPLVKRSRGRPRKKQDTTDRQTVPRLAIEYWKDSSKLLSATEENKDSDKPLLESDDTDARLPIETPFSNDTETDDVKDNNSLPLKKGRGRPRKKKRNRSLDASTTPFSNDIETDEAKDSNSLPLKKGRGRPKKKKRNRSLDASTTPFSNDIENDDVKDNNSLMWKKGRGRPRKKKRNRSLDATTTYVGFNQNHTCQSGNVIQRDSPPPLKRSRGRPRKKTDSNLVLPLVIEFPKESSVQLNEIGGTRNTNGNSLQKSSDMDVCIKTETQCCSEVLPVGSGLSSTAKKRKLNDKESKGSYGDDISSQYDDEEPSTNILQENILQENTIGEQVAGKSNKKVENGGSMENTANSSLLPEDIAFPRVVLFLAHNGKVAWDVKWRPVNVDDLDCKHRMGYLAAVLGNGSLEVWEVPSPSTIKLLYPSSKKDGTDPRFVKLEPVFRCSILKWRDRQCIPLTIEWSPSIPHDLIVAGCHDGTVAVWKFLPSASCHDTRPLLCFSADTAPIRSLAWAPHDDFESRNLIVTAGHGGLRFWDIRDPYRPLWELLPGLIYSVDWLKDLGCVVYSLDDGSLRLLSMANAAYTYDVLVNGKQFSYSQQQGLQFYYCSTFPIWSVQVSKLTGQAAYCSANGSILRFQLTRKVVDGIRTRNRTGHFCCGSLTEEDAILTVNTPLPIPFFIKKPYNVLRETPKSMSELDSTRAKRVEDETLDQPTVDLCCEDDYSLDIGSEGCVTAPKRKSAPKHKKNKSYPDLASPGPEGLNTIQNGENKEHSRTEVDFFPPKIVAMHRVRWNTNKGSERWLCSGGAAGIVRCQEIPMYFIGEI